MRYLTLIIILFLCGCESKETNNTQLVIGEGNVKEVNLSDGTKCAVYSKPYGGGITCNWRGENK